MCIDLSLCVSLVVSTSCLRANSTSSMFAAFDRSSPSSLSADVLSLSWKGDSKQGWLAAGNSRKTVGVTYTELKEWDEEWENDLFSEVTLERQSMRRNFNFREHSSEVSLLARNMREGEREGEKWDILASVCTVELLASPCGCGVV